MNWDDSSANSRALPWADNLFLRWRAEKLGLNRLADRGDEAPPEALLQQVWRYQRLRRDQLRTVDGRSVQIIHPGFWNREPGPDFRKAVIQMGDGPAVTGDVEIDLTPAGWERHAHAGNPNYQGVILQVTWDAALAAGRPVPVLPLRDALDSTVPELAFWVGVEPKPMPEGLPGRCSTPLRGLDPQKLRQVLRQAAQARLLRKAEQIQARARQVGWEGSLWEGLFGALGYKRNVWPMRRLAELLPHLRGERSPERSVREWQARLLGVAGLLPSDLEVAQHGYVRAVWDAWWREADALRPWVFPAGLWHLAGIRPANHPQRRIALAAHWAGRPELAGQLAHWLQRSIGQADLVPSIEEILRAGGDEFWAWQWTLRSRRMSKAQPLLGVSRVTDLAVNVILPWLYVRAWAGRSDRLAQEAEARYFLWPAGEDNSELKLSRQRLLGELGESGGAKFLATASGQQALLQIGRDFCDHSNAVCDHCAFPDLLASMQRMG